MTSQQTDMEHLHVVITNPIRLSMIIISILNKTASEWPFNAPFCEGTCSYVQHSVCYFIGNVA